MYTMNLSYNIVWRFPKMGVGTPKWSMYGFSITNHPATGRLPHEKTRWASHFADLLQRDPHSRPLPARFRAAWISLPHEMPQTMAIFKCFPGPKWINNDKHGDSHRFSTIFHCQVSVLDGSCVVLWLPRQLNCSLAPHVHSSFMGTNPLLSLAKIHSSLSYQWWAVKPQFIGGCSCVRVLAGEIPSSKRYSCINSKWWHIH